ncbi:MAG: hypothetical protein U5K71_09000 [Gracilimonas sp.]|nr:hypothetical protein [Gracilimonas sp.]
MISPQFTFPWYDWSEEDIINDRTGGWSFNIDFDFNFPDYGEENEDTGEEDTDNILPPCLAATSIQGSGKFS